MTEDGVAVNGQIPSNQELSKTSEPEEDIWFDSARNRWKFGKKKNISNTRPGDRVWSAATGNGPYVIVDFSEVSLSVRKGPRSENKFEVIKTAAWIVRDKYGQYIALPIHELTTHKPARNIAHHIMDYIVHALYSVKIMNMGS